MKDKVVSDAAKASIAGFIKAILQYSRQSTPVFAAKYSSTCSKVLQYSPQGTPVLTARYCNICRMKPEHRAVEPEYQQAWMKEVNRMKEVKGMNRVNRMKGGERGE